MQRTPIASSSIRSVGYDAKAALLEVEFSSGDIYQYFDVPEHLYRGLMDASSKGQFMNEHVRDAYRFEKAN